MPDKLSVFNGALRLIGERSLSALTENTEARRTLDNAWADNSIVRFCLERGQWNFATRAVELGYEPSIAPSFGYRRAFQKPADFVRTTHFCWDEYFKVPLTDYIDVTGYWYAEPDTVYVRYVSMASDTGLDFSQWTETFTQFVEAHLADQVAPRLTQSDRKMDRVNAEFNRLLRMASSIDAMESPQQQLAKGSWTTARGGARSRQTSRFTGGLF